MCVDIVVRALVLIRIASQGPQRFGGFEFSNGPVVGAYYDVDQVIPPKFAHSQLTSHQGELQGVLLVSQLSAENYSPSTGDRRKKEPSEDVFMSACFARKTKVSTSSSLHIPRPYPS